MHCLFAILCLVMTCLIRLLLSDFQGPPDNRGITYRAFDELFRMAKAVWGAYEYTFQVNPHGSVQRSPSATSWFSKVRMPRHGSLRS